MPKTLHFLLNAPSYAIYFRNKLKIWPKSAQNKITDTVTVNTFLQHTISFFKIEVFSVFKSQNISITKQQLKQAPGDKHPSTKSFINFIAISTGIYGMVVA